MPRSFAEESSFLKKESDVMWSVAKDFVPGMRVPGKVYVNGELSESVLEELSKFSRKGVEHGGFLPAVKQVTGSSYAFTMVSDACHLKSWKS